MAYAIINIVDSMSSGVSVVLLAVQLALNLSDVALKGDERYDVMQISGDISNYNIPPDSVGGFLDSMIEMVNSKIGSSLGDKKETVITSLEACKITATFDTRQTMSVVNTVNTGGEGKYYTWMYYFRKQGTDVSCQMLQAAFNCKMGSPYIIVHNHRDGVFGTTDYDEKIDLPAVVTVRAATIELSFALGPMVTNKNMADTPIIKSLIEGAKALPKDALTRVDSIDASRSTRQLSRSVSVEPSSSIIELSGSYKTTATNTDWEFAYY